LIYYNPTVFFVR